MIIANCHVAKIQRFNLLAESRGIGQPNILDCFDGSLFKPGISLALS